MLYGLCHIHTTLATPFTRRCSIADYSIRSAVSNSFDNASQNATENSITGLNLVFISYYMIQESDRWQFLSFHFTILRQNKFY